MKALRRPRLQALAVTLAALVVYSIGVGRPSPWRDEVATLASSRVPFATIVRDARTVDAVHTGYYLLVHLVARHGDNVAAGRWISVCCLAVTAGLVSLLGSRLRSPTVGLLAGALLVVSPLASRYAQESRPFALVTLTSTAATGALVLALQSHALQGQASREQASAGRRARLWWVGYALLVVATGLADVLGLAILVAHLAYVLLVARRRSAVAWVVSVAGALAVLAPFLRLASHQRDQVGSPARPTISTLVAYFTDVAGSTIGLVLLGLVALASLVLVVRAAPARDGRLAAPVLATTWGLAIPLAVFAGSQVHPFFATRYLLFCLPGLALVVALGLGSLPAPVALILVLVLAVTGLPRQFDERAVDGHGENLVALDTVVAAAAAPGTDVIFVPWSVRRVTQLEPALWGALSNPELEQPGSSTALFAERAASPTTLGRLARATRVIVITRSGTGASPVDGEDLATVAALRQGFTVQRASQVTGFSIEIAVRRPAGAR